MKNNGSKGKSSIRREYNTSPIIEAISEVYFSKTNNDFSVWGNFNNKLKKIYPNVKEVLIPKTELKMDQEGKTRELVSPEKLYRFINKNKTQLVQANKDFVSVNQLKPYQNYKKFRSDTKKVLKSYIDVVSPKIVDRIGMRYINQINIGEESIELSDYFKFMPQIPTEVTEGINDVLLQIRFVPKGSKHLITTSLRSGANESQTVFFLDIYDILPINNEVNLDIILNILDEAHDNVERVFEGFITDKARELFGVTKNDT